MQCTDEHNSFLKQITKDHIKRIGYFKILSIYIMLKYTLGFFIFNNFKTKRRLP